MLTLCGGTPWKGAAENLSIHVSTVRFHVANINRKTGAENLISALWKIATA